MNSLNREEIYDFSMPSRSSTPSFNFNQHPMRDNFVSSISPQKCRSKKRIVKGNLWDRRIQDACNRLPPCISHEEYLLQPSTSNRLLDDDSIRMINSKHIPATCGNASNYSVNFNGYLNPTHVFSSPRNKLPRSQQINKQHSYPATSLLESTNSRNNESGLNSVPPSCQQTSFSNNNNNNSSIAQLLSNVVNFPTSRLKHMLPQISPNLSAEVIHSNKKTITLRKKKTRKRKQTSLSDHDCLALDSTVEQTNNSIDLEVRQLLNEVNAKISNMVNGNNSGNEPGSVIACDTHAEPYVALVITEGNSESDAQGEFEDSISFSPVREIFDFPSIKQELQQNCVDTPSFLPHCQFSSDNNFHNSGIVDDNKDSSCAINKVNLGGLTAGQELINEAALTNSNLNLTTDEELNKCIICNELVSSLKFLRHTYEHFELCSIRCKLCNKSFIDIDAAKLHISDGFHALNDNNENMFEFLQIQKQFRCLCYVYKTYCCLEASYCPSLSKSVLEAIVQVRQLNLSERQTEMIDKLEQMLIVEIRNDCYSVTATSFDDSTVEDQPILAKYLVDISHQQSSSCSKILDNILLVNDQCLEQIENVDIVNDFPLENITETTERLEVVEENLDINVSTKSQGDFSNYIDHKEDKLDIVVNNKERLTAQCTDVKQNIKFSTRKTKSTRLSKQNCQNRRKKWKAYSKLRNRLVIAAKRNSKLVSNRLNMGLRKVKTVNYCENSDDHDDDDDIYCNKPDISCRKQFLTKSEKFASRCHDLSTIKVVGNKRRRVSSGSSLFSTESETDSLNQNELNLIDNDQKVLCGTVDDASVDNGSIFDDRTCKQHKLLTRLSSESANLSNAASNDAAATTSTKLRSFYRCAGCKQDVAESDVDDHVFAVHLPDMVEVPFRCSHCDKIACSVQAMLDHCYLSHRRFKPSFLSYSSQKWFGPYSKMRRRLFE